MSILVEGNDYKTRWCEKLCDWTGQKICRRRAFPRWGIDYWDGRWGEVFWKDWGTCLWGGICTSSSKKFWGIRKLSLSPHSKLCNAFTRGDRWISSGIFKLSSDFYPFMLIKMKNNNQHLAETHEEDFLNDLLMQAGFNPEEDNFEELKDELEPILIDRIMVRVFEKLTEPQRKEVMKLFDAEKEAEALEKIEKLIPNYDEFLAGVFEEFQEEYLANMELPEEDEK